MANDKPSMGISSGTPSDEVFSIPKTAVFRNAGARKYIFFSRCKTVALLLAFFCVPILSPASGETVRPEGVVHELEEMIVTATRVEVDKKKVAANITVVTAEDLENMPVSNVAKVLQYVPGVYVELNGGPGSDASTVRIQGSESRQVTVYQDGVPLNQLANPVTDLSYLPVDAIDRIEIYKGAASSSWGSALGGVINIITKDPVSRKPYGVDARVSYGDFKTVKSRGSFSGATDRLGWFFSFTHEKSDGFVEHTAYEQDAVYAKLNYDPGTGSRLNFVYSHDEGQNADPAPAFPAFWDNIQRKRTYQRLLFDTAPADNMMLTLEGRHHRYHNTIHDVYPARRVVYNDYNDELWGGSARFHWDTAKTNTFTAGFDGDRGRYDWINYRDEYDTGYWAAYANDTCTVGNFTFNGGFRHDDNKDFGSAVSPSGGIVYRIKGPYDALVRAQIAKGFSAPPAAWVHDPTWGNPDLKPETVVNHQLGGEVRFFKIMRFELNLFHANVKDLVRFDPIANRYENVDAVTRKGIEGSLSADFDFGLSLKLGGSYVKVKDKSTNQVIQDIPKALYNVSALYTYRFMTHSLLGKYVDHNSSYAETEDRVFVFDYGFKLGLPVSKKYGKVSLYGSVYNLFDTTYLYRKVWPKPGRWGEAGVRFEY